MKNTKPIGLYTIDEFKFRIDHTIENIKEIFNKWVIEDTYEMNILRAKSVCNGFTARQFTNIIGSLCKEIIKLTGRDYRVWGENIACKLYRIINEEIKILGDENLLQNYSNNDIYELIMNIVRENLSSNKDSLIYYLIKI